MYLNLWRLMSQSQKEQWLMMNKLRFNGGRR